MTTRLYLKKLYPYELVCDMLTMTRPARVSSTTESMEEDEVEKRPERFYRNLGFSFDSVTNPYWRDKTRLITSRQAFIEQLHRRVPEQVHFGSLQLYDNLGRETLVKQVLVFDLDVTDFARHCDCVGGAACPLCWLHIEGASALLHDLLVDRLGIDPRHLLWVLSGKKGVHCLVNAPLYVTMTTEQRTNLYLWLLCDSLQAMREFGATLSGGETQRLEQMFVENAVCRRDLMQRESFREDCLERIVRVHFPSLYHALELKWRTASSSLEKWLALKALELNQFPGQVPPSLLIVLHCYYPRIDKGPLCERKHLIKLPFSVHKDTKNIALPVERQQIVARHGLPTETLSFAALMDHYKKTRGEVHPHFAEACRVFAHWLGSA